MSPSSGGTRPPGRAGCAQQAESECYIGIIGQILGLYIGIMEKNMETTIIMMRHPSPSPPSDFRRVLDRRSRRELADVRHCFEGARHPEGERV